MPPMANAAVIRVAGLGKSYETAAGLFPALKGVDLDVRPGEFIAIMGPSGSGKSTSMNILGCLDTPTSGSYYFRGVDVGTLDRSQRALLRRNYIGFVFQGFNLLKRTTARENLELPLIYRRETAAQRKAAAMKALALVGLTDRANHTSSELSGGQQQRVAIARALVTDPAVIFADEPTGNLDSARSHEIMKLLTELNVTRQITIVLVTHEEDIASYAKRQIRFKDGKIASDTLTQKEPVA